MKDALLEGVAEAALDQVAEVAEVYAKEGRSRLVGWTPAGYRVLVRNEEGWALRAGGAKSSLFYASSGRPDPATRWPIARAQPLQLPLPVPEPDWVDPPELAVPLISENEGLALVEALRQAVGEEAPEARIRWILLEDGSSRSALFSTRGMRSTWRHRSASLRLGMSAGDGGIPLTLELADRQARAFHPQRIGSRLADRLLVRQKGRLPDRDRGEFLLAPAVTIPLVAGLLPGLCGAQAKERLAKLCDRGDRLGNALVTLVDDGRLPGGALAAGVDGEGLPTRRVVLVDEGVFVQPLVAWWDAGQRPGWRPCASRRDSWREPPLLGPTHFFLQPRQDQSVADLLAGVPRGYYLIELAGTPRIDVEGDRFALPVSGFSLAEGRVRGAVAGGWLCGSLRAFLQGIQAVGRDLTFLPMGGMIGAPSLVATGLELRSSP